MKITEITEKEYKSLMESNIIYFANGCLFEEDTDNLVAFGWYDSALTEVCKFYRVEPLSK